jgi:hypothetical protein
VHSHPLTGEIVHLKHRKQAWIPHRKLDHHTDGWRLHSQTPCTVVATRTGAVPQIGQQFAPLSGTHGLIHLNQLSNHTASGAARLTICQQRHRTATGVCTQLSQAIHFRVAANDWRIVHDDARHSSGGRR